MSNRCRKVALLVGVALSMASVLASAQDSSTVQLARDSLTVRFARADLSSVIQALGRFLPKPVLLANVPPARVSLETPRPIPRTQVRSLLEGILDSQSLLLAEESTFFAIRAKATPVTGGMPPTLSSPATPPQHRSVQLYVVRLLHARAADVAANINFLFGGAGEFSGGRGLTTGTLSDELRRNVVAPTAPAGEAPAPTNTSSGGSLRGASLGGPVTIVPDEITNSLLVRASPEDFQVLEQAVAALDIRPLQVLIEVLIVEARADRTFSLGSDLFVPTQSLGGKTTAGATLTGGGLGDLVVTVMNLGSANVNATIRAAAGRGDVEIVSRPVLLASNNTEAHLLVGSQRPFVQVSRSLPTDAPSRDQVVQYRDVGTKLMVRPTINYDGYVSLQIQQEVNAATSETQFDAPIISTREAATRVLVRDGQTIVLGGLRDLQHDASQSGVPLLSGIPLLGGLFGSARRQRTATELYLFLTPHILKTDADADSVTAPHLPRDLRK